MCDEVLLTTSKDQICTLTLNRLAKRNALSIDLITKMGAALHRITEDEEVRVVIIRGAGDKIFSAGFDIASLSQSHTDAEANALLQSHPLDALLNAIEELPCPVIAMMNGSAYGGGVELAIACDLRIAADDIHISISASKLGVVYPWKGLLRFVQTIGLSTTQQLLYTAQQMDSREMEERGIVHKVVHRNELCESTYALARQIASNSSSAMRGSKRILNMLRRSQCLNRTDRKEADALWKDSLSSRDVERNKTNFFKK